MIKGFILAILCQVAKIPLTATWHPKLVPPHKFISVHQESFMQARQHQIDAEVRFWGLHTLMLSTAKSHCDCDCDCDWLVGWAFTGPSERFGEVCRLGNAAFRRQCEYVSNGTDYLSITIVTIVDNIACKWFAVGQTSTGLSFCRWVGKVYEAKAIGWEIHSFGSKSHHIAVWSQEREEGCRWRALEEIGWSRTPSSWRCCSYQSQNGARVS